MLLDARSPHAIAEAADVLARGELLGLPTETVYGLAADAGQDAAVRQIFAAKGRPADHPLIVHVCSRAEVAEFARDVPPFAQRLMDAFWPGPLTLILPRRADRAAVAAGGQDSVGLRCPAHPAAQAVLHAARARGVWGVAAPSANLFGRVSPTTAAHVQAEFPDLCVLDGGACEVGIESVIVDCTRGAPVVLRPGMLTLAQLSAACAQPVTVEATPANAQAETSRAADRAAAPKASGTLASHYAPRAQVRLMDRAALQAALANRASAAPGAGVPSQVACWSRWQPAAWPADLRHQAMPAQASACAHALFATLRDFDALGVDEIWVEAPPAEPDWAGVSDRLRRAATPTR